jgi:hypothetical protein
MRSSSAPASRIVVRSRCAWRCGVVASGVAVFAAEIVGKPVAEINKSSWHCAQPVRVGLVPVLECVEKLLLLFVREIDGLRGSGSLEGTANAPHRFKVPQLHEEELACVPAQGYRLAAEGDLHRILGLVGHRRELR